MLRQHERTVAWKAGLLALSAHALLIGALLISFAWKTSHTVVNVSDVELWSELPNNVPPAPPLPEIQPQLPQEVQPLPEPIPEPEPIIKQPPEPEVPKVDIVLENKKKAEEKKRKKLEEERKKKELAKKSALKKKKLAEKKRREQLRRLQAEAFDDEVVDENEKRLKDLQEMSRGDAGQPSGPNKGEVNKYVSQIQAKIRGNVNSSLCGDGKPQLTIKIKMLPTGDFSSTPKVTRSSGNSACDDAVERATIASEPLPLPKDPADAAAFRDLNLTFYPNGR